MASQIVDQQQSHPQQIRAAIYARVSIFNGQDPVMQTRELREYCERRGWDVVAEYIDVGISGAKDRRPELDKLMADARRRRFDVVAVWRFDRFARSVRHLLRALDEYQALKIDFVSLTESVDTSTPSGRMTFTVLGAVAELERSLIAERVRAGLRNARARGVRLGRPKAVGDPDRIEALRRSGASGEPSGASWAYRPKLRKKWRWTAQKIRQTVSWRPSLKISTIQTYFKAAHFDEGVYPLALGIPIQNAHVDAGALQFLLKNSGIRTAPMVRNGNLGMKRKRIPTHQRFRNSCLIPFRQQTCGRKRQDKE
jgi:DNA invertase Pin-like site-specific DNA recombinase